MPNYALILLAGAFAISASGGCAPTDETTLEGESANTGEACTSGCDGNSAFDPSRTYGSCSPESVDCPENGASGWGDADSEACQCSLSCDTSADCPDPGTGSPEVRCVADVCQLRCDEGQTCPDDMECTLKPVDDAAPAFEQKSEYFCMQVFAK